MSTLGLSKQQWQAILTGLALYAADAEGVGSEVYSENPRPLSASEARDLAVFISGNYKQRAFVIVDLDSEAAFGPFTSEAQAKADRLHGDQLICEILDPEEND